MRDKLIIKEKEFRVVGIMNQIGNPGDDSQVYIPLDIAREIFDKQDELSNLLGIGKLNMVNQSIRKNSNKELDKIYADLIEEMNKNNFIIIIY